MCGLLDVIVALESCMICRGWSCGCVRSTRGIVCVNYHTPRTPISVHCNFVVRHGNLTSIRDVVFVSCFLTLCSSSSVWFNDYVFMILLSRTKNSIFFVSILDQSLAQGCVQLESFGLAGLWLCEASPRPSLFPMCFWHSSFSSRSEASLFSRVRFWFFFCPFLYGSSLKVLLTWLSIRPLFCQIVLNPNYVLLVYFLLSDPNLITPIQESDSDLLSKYPTNHRWSASWSTVKDLFLCVSEHRYNSEISENRSSDHWVSSLEQYDPIFVISHDKPEILTSFDIWTLDLGLLLFFWRMLLRFSSEVASSTLYTAVENGCPSCKISSVLHGECKFTVSLENVPSLLIWILWRESQMVEIGFRYNPKITSPTSPRVQGVSQEYSRKDFCVELHVFDLGLLMNDPTFMRCLTIC